MKRRVVTAGILLGMGFGGFFDGIVLHQILQWHHMVTSAGYPATTVANLEFNTLWDGLFHALAWLLTLAGVIVLWNALRARRNGQRWPSRVLLGAGLAGWGIFNLVEGVINHHILQIHHVREASAQPLLWDVGFLAWGAVMVVVGWVMVRGGRQ